MQGTIFAYFCAETKSAMNIKRLLCLILLIVPALAFTASPVSIDFEVKGMPDGYGKIFGVLGTANYLLDSFPTVKEKAHYEKKELVKSGLYYFVLPANTGFFQLLLDKDQQFVMKTDTSDIVGKMRITGSDDNQLFYENIQYENTFHSRLDSIDAELKKFASDHSKTIFLQAAKDKLLKNRKDYLADLAKNHAPSFFTQFKLAGQNPELQYPKNPDGSLDSVQQMILYRDSYWNNTSLTDEKLVRTPVIANKLKTYITQLIPQTADSVIKYADRIIEQSKSCPECFKFLVNWIAIHYQKPTFMGADKVLVHIADQYFTDEYATPWFKDNPYELVRIRTKVNDMRPSLVGTIGQNLTCKNLNGEYESLYDLKTPLKILFMFSPDCSHCQEETPHLKALVDRWKGKVDVYALCVDKEDLKWKAFVSKYHTEAFHNVSDPNLESKYYKKYHFESTPGIFVLDPSNKIVAKDLYPNQLDQVFETELTKLGMR
ncbi:MAG: hypothetical protein JWN78_2577 [Bacteroidota bacterium]|nr:hypothetical protein [Bacteroidota bacterium]